MNALCDMCDEAEATLKLTLVNRNNSVMIDEAELCIGCACEVMKEVGVSEEAIRREAAKSGITE